MNPDRDLRTSFDEVAQLYDEARPGYPEQLVEDVLALSEIPPGGSILEVGCGPGQATLPFARRGYSMLCLELGENLAILAAKNCRQYPNVRIQHTAFEDWELQRKSFDLVVSAQAFGWIAPEIGYPKAAESLKDLGSIALFWNDISVENAALSCALLEWRRLIAPQTFEDGRSEPSTWTAMRAVDEMKASGLFGEVTVRRYPWSKKYPAERYIKLISTFSPIRGLNEEARHKLCSGAQELIKRFGGMVDVGSVAVLCIAKVKR